jgi:maleylpyruvate isomerase
MIVRGAELVEVRRLKRAATQRLLGETIAISESDWLVPTALPGWTRAHVATHLARNADVLRRYVTRLASRPELERDDLVSDLEAGARRSPLDIQIDLDTASGLLNDAFDKLTPEQWSTRLHGRLEGLTVSDLPMLRLNEVVLHHVDLDCGLVLADIDPMAAEWLLEWNVYRRADLARGPGIRLTTTSGRVLEMGGGRGVSEVTGSATNLLGWVTGRLPRTAVSGAEHVSIGPVR